MASQESEQLISVSNKELSLITVGLLILNLSYHGHLEDMEMSDRDEQEKFQTILDDLAAQIESCQPIHSLTKKLELISNLTKNANLPAFPGLH